MPASEFSSPGTITMNLTTVSPSLLPHRDQCAHPLVAQKDPARYQRGNNNRKDQAEERLVAAQLRSDRAAKIAGQQDRAEHRGARNDVKGDTDQLRDPETDSSALGKTELGECLHDCRRPHNMNRGIEK